MDYKKLHAYLEKNNLLNSEDVVLLEKEIIYLQKIDGSVYKLIIGRFDEDAGADMAWSMSCKKETIRLLRKRKNLLIYTNIDSNFIRMSSYITGFGFEKLNENEFFLRS